MSFRLPWQDQSDPIWMPQYEPGTPRLTGMQRRGKVRPVKERTFGPGFTDQANQQRRMWEQANRKAVTHSAVGADTYSFPEPPSWVHRALNPESFLPHVVQQVTPAHVLGQIDRASGDWMQHIPKVIPQHQTPALKSMPREDWARSRLAAALAAPDRVQAPSVQWLQAYAKKYGNQRQVRKAGAN